MGSHVVVRPFRYGGDDWEGLDSILQDEAADLNRDWFDAMMLSNQLREKADLFLLALDDARVVGFVALTRGDSDRTRHVAQLRLHVRREYRSNGVGAKLLRRALFWSDRNGITRVVATPYVPHGFPAERREPEAWNKVRFFERFGFAVEGINRKAARLLDGTYTNVAHMARVIPAKEDTHGTTA